MKPIGIVVSLLVAGSPAFAQAPAGRQPLPADSLQLARLYAQWFSSNQVDSLQAHMPADARTPQAREGMLDQLAQVASQIGQETAVVEERWVRRLGNRQYWRISRYSEYANEPIVLRIVVLRDGGMGGFGVNPLSQVPPVDPEPDD